MRSAHPPLPHQDSRLFITDAGLETDLIFNKGVDIPEFAAHTLLASDTGRTALTDYYRRFLTLADHQGIGMVLDCPTWKAHRHWAASLGATAEDLARANRTAVRFMDELRRTHGSRRHPVVLNGLIGPKGDAYAPETAISAAEARDYHAEQLGWLVDTPVDMVSALTMTQSPEALGIVQAATRFDLPVVISFTVESDGRLPSGQHLAEAIQHVDWATDSAAAWFMVNCAHPDHMAPAFDGGSWMQRIRGIRCNASRLSHAELDACETLDAGNPAELAVQYQALRRRMPWITVVGGCCGTDYRHVAAIVDRCRDI